MMSAYRMVLAMPGKERTIHQYKRPVDFRLAERKAAELASLLFPSWSWVGDADLQAAEAEDGDMVLILPSDAKGAIECTL